jgi:hypothetical protein
MTKIERDIERAVKWTDLITDESSATTVTGYITVALCVLAMYMFMHRE